MGGNGLFQCQAEGWTENFMFESKSHIGGEKADLVAAIIGDAVVFQAVEGLGCHQADHGVGDLDFTTGTRLLLFDLGEDFGLQDVATGDDEVGGRGFALWLFHHAVNHEVVVLPVLWRNDAVAVHVFPSGFLNRQHIAATAFMVDIDHLLQAAGFRFHDHVRQQHGKGFIAHQVSGAPNGVAQAPRVPAGG